MQVILLKNIPKIGKRGDVLTVSDGYASHYLFPRKFAERATLGRISHYEKGKDLSLLKEKENTEMLIKKIDEMQEKGITLFVKADSVGHLYKKIHANDIFDVLTQNHDLPLSKENISLPEIITKLGEFHVDILLNEKEKRSLPVFVVQEGEK
jgi:large subunit ribosomal protein L9